MKFSLRHMARVTPGTGSAATPGSRSAAVSGWCRSASFPAGTAASRRIQAQGLSRPSVRQTPANSGADGTGYTGRRRRRRPVLPHPAAGVKRRAGIQGVVPAPEHIDIVHSLTSLPPAYHDPPPGATVTPGIVVKFDEFQGVQGRVGEVPVAPTGQRVALGRPPAAPGGGGAGRGGGGGGRLPSGCGAEAPAGSRGVMYVHGAPHTYRFPRRLSGAGTHPMPGRVNAFLNA